MKWDEQAPPIEVTQHQKEIIAAAVTRLREWKGEALPEGRALEIICVDFIESFKE